MNPQDLFSHFSILIDYRQDWKVEHKLSDVLLLTVWRVQRAGKRSLILVVTHILNG